MRHARARDFFQFIAFFVLIFSFSFFDELVVLGGVKFGVVWKAVFLVCASVYLIFVNPIRMCVVSYLGVAYGVKSIVYVYNGLTYFLLDLGFAIKFLISPVLAEWMRAINIDHFLLRTWCSRLALALCFSVVPFMFGLKPIVEADTHSLSIYGLDDEFEFAGIFGNKHNAAVSLACSFLIVFDSFFASRRKSARLLYVVAGLLALYGIYITYARTGMLCLLVGIFSYHIYTNGFFSALKRLGLSLGVIAPLAIFAFSTSEVFRMRLLGVNLYTDDDSLSQVGSGRFDFWIAAIENWWSGSEGSVFIGLGLEQARDLMMEKVGLRIFAHNGFVDALQISGLVGFLLFVMYVTFFGRFLLRRASAYKPLVASIYFGWIAVLLIQGGVIFWQSVFLAFSLALVLLSEREVLKKC